TRRLELASDPFGTRPQRRRSSHGGTRERDARRRREPVGLHKATRRRSRTRWYVLVPVRWASIAEPQMFLRDRAGFTGLAAAASRVAHEPSQPGSSLCSSRVGAGALVPAGGRKRRTG